MKKFNRKLLKRDDDMVEQEWRSGENTRLPAMWPGFKSRLRHHMTLSNPIGYF